MTGDSEPFKEPSEETKAKNRATGYIFAGIVAFIMIGAMFLRACHAG
jgi:hypothetical protein